MSALLDLSGQKFGIWSVIEQAPRRDNKTRWLCRCTICGKVVSHRSTALRKGVFSTCDGRHLRRPSTISRTRKPSGHAAATEVFNLVRARAKKRGLDFSLSRDFFVSISAMDCHYCGAPPSNKNSRRHFNGPFVYSGIDRKDSSRGYVEDNCLPCCGTCNVLTSSPA